MTNIKLVLIGVLVSLGVGVAVGYKLFHQPPKTIVDVKTVHDTKVIERVIKGKDGTVVTEVIRETKTETIEKTKPVIPNIRVGLMGGYDFKERKADYGLVLTKPINQKLEVSGYFKPNNQEIGVFGTWGF